jgi:hypothetical protein
MNLPWWKQNFPRILTALVLLGVALGGRPGSVPLEVRAALAGPPYRYFFPGAVHYQGPPAPNLPPRPTTSYYFYMGNYTQTKARNLGCKLGTADKILPGAQDNLVILDFGITKFKDGQYGASGMKIGGFYTMDQIADAVQQFGIGYWDCTADDFGSQLHIGIGTNNYNDSDVYSYLSVTYNHGKAWAEMVNRVNDWFVNVCPNRCNGQVDAMGANDIELAWSSAAAAIDWVKGYDSVNKFSLINFGAAEGCPDFCGSSEYRWTKDQVLQVTATGPIYSLPEIYLNSGANARQWYLLSVYSVQKRGYPMDFAGTLTNFGACAQAPGDPVCPYIDNTPEEGWTQLYNLINGANVSTYDDLTYSSDIEWTD